MTSQRDKQMLYRRRFVVAALAMTVSPIAGRAQTSAKVARVGVLSIGKQDADAARSREAFVSGLRSLGWVEGKNLAIEERWAPDAREITQSASELVRLRPDVIVTPGPQATQAVAKLTAEIPVVFLFVANPVTLGVARSLSHPGGNVTGLATVVPEGYAGKLVELLKESAPRTSTIGLLTASGNAMHPGFVKSAEESGPQRGVKFVTLSVREAKDIEPAFDAAKREGADAIIVPGDVFFLANREQLGALALRHRLPSVFMFAHFVDAGGLLAYGVSVSGFYRSAARPVDKILRGVPPRDIPVEQPTLYELTVNLKTARALGLTIPQSLLVRAERVIE